MTQPEISVWKTRGVYMKEIYWHSTEISVWKTHGVYMKEIYWLILLHVPEWGGICRRFLQKQKCQWAPFFSPSSRIDSQTLPEANTLQLTCYHCVSHTPAIPCRPSPSNLFWQVFLRRSFSLLHTAGSPSWDWCHTKMTPALEGGGR